MSTTKSTTKRRTRTVTRWVNWYNGEPGFVLFDSESDALVASHDYYGSSYGGASRVTIHLPRAPRSKGKVKG